MDPLSITTAVFQITTIYLKAAKDLNDIWNKWKHAPITVLSLCSQLKLNEALLSRLQALLLDDTNPVHAEPPLVDALETTLISWLVLGSCLGEYVSKIRKGVHGDGSMSSKAKFRTLWNEAEVKGWLEQLHQQYSAINTLIGPLNMDSSAERQKLLQEQEQSKTMTTMNEHTQHMRKPYALTVAESTFKTEDSPSSLLSNLSTLVDPTDVSSEQHFESVLSSSRVYKKASNAAMRQRPNTDFDNASMMTNHSTTATIGDPDFITDPSNTEEDSANTRPIIVHISDPVDRAKRNLNVAGVTGICTESYSTQEPGKLSYKPHDRIQNLRKVDAAWWFGTTESSETVPEKSGIVFRRDFYPIYRLNEWKSAYTGRSMGTEAVGEGWLRYDEGDRVEFNRIYHNFMWHVRVCRNSDHHAGSNDIDSRCHNASTEGQMLVDVMVLSDEIREQVDTLLEHSACPIPRLVGLEGRERYQEIIKMVNETSWLESQEQIIADCKNFGELQEAAKIWRKCGE